MLLSSIVLAFISFFNFIPGAQSVFTGGWDLWNIPDNATWIRELRTTLALPKAPNPHGSMSLWAGMITENGDFIQALAQSYAPDQTVTEGMCVNLGMNNWCAVSSTLVAADSSHQTMGQGNSIATPNSTMTSHYKYNDATQKYDQYTLVNGKQVSLLSTTSGHGISLTANGECTSVPNCGTFPAYTWLNTVIKLDEPSPDYGKGLMLVPGATGRFKTADGGRTWTSDAIHIPMRSLPQQQGQASVPSP